MNKAVSFFFNEAVTAHFSGAVDHLKSVKLRVSVISRIVLSLSKSLIPIPLSKLTVDLSALVAGLRRFKQSWRWFWILIKLAPLYGIPAPGMGPTDGLVEFDASFALDAQLYGKGLFLFLQCAHGRHVVSVLFETIIAAIGRALVELRVRKLRVRQLTIVSLVQLIS